MNKKMIISGTLCVIMLVALFSTIQVFARGRGDGPIIYVTSQGLYYDSIVTADPLPDKGPFQLLEVGPLGLQTEFGPGDRGYVGGRWWMDTDGNGVMDDTDHYFSCPLLGPGRLAP
jgi:hypothetical protein